MTEKSTVYVVKHENDPPGFANAYYVAYKPDGTIDNDYELPIGTGFLLLPDGKTVLDVCGREWPLKIIPDNKGEVTMENQISINNVLDNIEKATPSNEEINAFHDGMSAGVKLANDIKTNAEKVDERNLGREYLEAGHNPVRDYARRNAIANYNKNYRRPGISFNNKRFMDCSYDDYNAPANSPVIPNAPQYNYLYANVSSCMNTGNEIQVAEKRLMMIKDSISVSEWDILNATNFTSPIDQVKRYIEIIDKLGKAGVFDPETENENK